MVEELKAGDLPVNPMPPPLPIPSSKNAELNADEVSTEKAAKDAQAADELFAKKAIEKGYVKLEDVDIKTGGGIAYKQSIATPAVIALVASFIWFMHSQQLIDWWNIYDRGFLCVLWIVFWTGMLSIGVKKESIFALGMAIMQIWNDKTMTNEQKLAAIMQQVQLWLSWVADLSQLLAMKKKK